MKLSYSWAVVGAGMLMTCIGIGAMMSLAVFLVPMSEQTGWSRAAISSVATIDFLCMGVGSIVWGMLSDRIGARRVVLIGGALLAGGLYGASRATTLLELQLTFGVLIGAAAGSFYAPMISAATGWLNHRRNLAAALVSAGMGMGSMVVAPFAGWVLGQHDWRTAMMIMAVAALCLVLPAAMLVRDPPVSIQPISGQTGHAARDGQYALTAGQALLKPQFAVIAMARSRFSGHPRPPASRPNPHSVRGATGCSASRGFLP